MKNTRIKAEGITENEYIASYFNAETGRSSPSHSF
jgi:hypothetical protein